MTVDDRRETPEFSTRRGILAGLVSALVAALPVGIGSGFFLAPLWRRKKNATGDEDGFVSLELSLEALPPDGTPLLVTVTKDKVNAWNMYPDSPIGSIWIRNVQGNVMAFNSICPHLGCAVEHRSAHDDFFCPCHNSNFGLDGTRINQIPPRDLDALETKLVDGQIWVRYRNFRAGTAEPIEV